MSFNFNPNYQQDDIILPKTNYNSPFYSSVPLSSQPTEVLSKRFELWRQILKSLINYYKSISIANQQYSRINDNLIQTINFPFFTNIHPKLGANNNVNNKIYEPNVDDMKKQTYFAKFGNGSIQDVQILLKKYHLNLAEQQRKISLEMTNVLVPRLEELVKDLFNKIREIKNLHSDFKNNLNQEIAITGQYLDDYAESIRFLQNNEGSKINAKRDPYLLRLKLEIQLKQQLYQENYLEEAFINLQITGLELEKIIYKEVQNSLNRYNELISQEIFVMYNDLIEELHQGIISQKPFFEWDDFIMKDSTAEHKRHFLTVKHDDKLPIPRKISTVKYPFSKDLMSKSIRSGFFLKKSKLLKNYNKSFFILTLNFLHEFKSDNLVEHFTPINSINLNDCILTESNDMKFQLHIKNYGSDNKLKTHNFVFKRIPSEMGDLIFKKWIIDLKNLSCFNSFHERFRFIKGKLSNSNSRSNTPMFEISNPMDSDILKVNEKLQSLQITSIHHTSNNDQTPSIVTTDHDLTPPATDNNLNHGDHDHKEFELNIKNEPFKLNPSSLALKRNSNNKPKKPSLQKLNLDNVPKFEIQEPTPIHKSNELPIVSNSTTITNHNRQKSGDSLNSNGSTTTSSQSGSPSGSQSGSSTPKLGLSKSPISSPPISSPLQHSFFPSTSPEQQPQSQDDLDFDKFRPKSPNPQNIIPQQIPQFPGYTPSINSSINTNGSTQQIGSVSNGIEGGLVRKQKSHIDLHGSLYRKKKQKDDDDAGLNKVLDALKSEV
ncbi:Phosphatidylinositol 4,5-bisphosphate effector protein [Wickerhamomyces ciferrii]|uniref:Phosphatidylinositol 4,5-bisphosphate effector protein n=1 Tax=Wickerhamomyces ciferrii (strain ATCC 14091 / BCRC 22168 / CBS 111 / JCM 3599 / NBRC 0793 / NRRL Y-1031 F-60-10) TaxID=1206466 RepID=K0K8J0_WICCF|nr:Phosphatidylinositol 4,5-bisphosphate effector protein [Wickerhamomyces ciferrii]CCH41160.1 Phosphatidylinositol 4,5-bisphosphate effector protein [Wickerhamomyces ciferrii]